MPLITVNLYMKATQGNLKNIVFISRCPLITCRLKLYRYGMCCVMWRLVAFSRCQMCHFFFRFFVVHISYIHVLGHQGINENRILFISGTNETALKGRFITVVVSVLKMIVDVVAVIIISVQQGSIFDTLSVIEFSLSHDMSKNRGPHACTLGIKQFFFIAFKVQRLVVMVFNATFNNISFISWWVSFLVEENL